MSDNTHLAARVKHEAQSDYSHLAARAKHHAQRGRYFMIVCVVCAAVCVAAVALQLFLIVSR